MSDTAAVVRRTGAAPLTNAGTGVFAAEVLTAEERFAASVYQGFLSGIKGVWRDEIYAAVTRQAEALKSQDVDTLEAAMQPDPAYFLYSWLERRSQQFKYTGRFGLQTLATRHLADIEALLPPAEQDSVAVPAYIADIDVHQHPGGLWSDAAHAVAHEWYQTGSSFSGVSTDGMVRLYVDTIRRFTPPDGDILDLGCTLGRMALALKRALPAARVTGVDVCPPVLRVARQKAEREALEVAFVQANAERLPFGSQSFDVVASQWLFHELPRDAIANVLDETARLLRPGGTTAIFDMQHVPGGVIGAWLHKGYGVRNNEPYGEGYAALDIRHALAARGFTDIEMIDFDPDTGHTRWVDELPAKRTHYNTMITARRGG